MSRPPIFHDPAGDLDASFELQTLGAPYDVSNGSSSPPLSSIHPSWKRSLHELLEYPSASSASFLVHILTNSLIVFSALVTVFETIPSFRISSESPRIFFGIESSLVALFTVEYIARALAWTIGWKVFWGWALSFFGIVDLLAILPYYIELCLGVDTSAMFRFSILRTFRLLRVFRAFRTNNTITLTIEVMYLSVRHSQHALLALGFFLVMFLVIFSTVLQGFYLVCMLSSAAHASVLSNRTERGTWDPVLQTFIDVDGEPSQFSSIPAAGWFVLVTITTVGYGDLTPRSFLGRFLTVPLLVFGLLLIALPSFVLGREFSKLWDAHVRENARILAEESRQGESDLDEPSVAALARQIIDLRGALDAQGQMLGRLLSATEALSEIRKEQGPGNRGAVLFDTVEDDVYPSRESESEVDLGKEGSIASRNIRSKFATDTTNRWKGKSRVSSSSLVTLQSSPATEAIKDGL